MTIAGMLMMLFFHVIMDFKLQQGWMAEAKQVSWWKENAPDKKYRHDYLVILFMHSFSWSFGVIAPPLFILGCQSMILSTTFIYAVFINTWIHMVVDSAKCNLFIINLWQDQLCHLIQIVTTAIVLFQYFN